MLRVIYVAALGSAAICSSAAFAQSSVTLYGRMDTAISYQSNANGHGDSVVRIGSGALSGSRWGLMGKENLGSGLDAIFMLENGFSPDTGSAGQGGRLFGRQAFVGLSGTYGRLTAGRQVSLLYEHQVNFDPLGFTNVDESSFFLNYMPTRFDNSVRYGGTIGGFNMAGMYAFGEVPGSFSASSYRAVNLGYTRGAFSVDSVYQQLVPNTTVAGNAARSSSSMLGANYDFGRARLIANYIRSRQGSGDRSDIYSIGGSWQATPALTLSLAVYLDDIRTAANQSGRRYTVGGIADYSLSKRTDAYFYVDFTRTRDAYDSDVIPAALAPANTLALNQNSRSNVMVGLRHKF
jgi:predicted porin